MIIWTITAQSFWMKPNGTKEIKNTRSVPLDETHFRLDHSLIYNASAGHEQHECDTSYTNATLATRVRHECYTNDTSATQWKILILITTRVKTYFYTLIFTIWPVNNYKEPNKFILRTTFWKRFFSMPECV